MKNLVVFYSRTGITKKVADYLARSMGCDLEEIVDLKDRRGPKGYLVGGKDAATKKLTEIEESKKDLAVYDTVIIGTPVWAFTMTPAVRTYIQKNKEQFKKVAFFCTQHGSGSKRTFRDMEALCEKKPISTLEVTEGQVKKDTCKPKMDEFVGSIVAHG